MPIIERIKQKVSIYSIAEGCFLAVFGCYLLFLLQSTTTYHFELSTTLEHDLLSALIVITPLKCLALLWQKREELKKWLVLLVLSWLVCWAYLMVFWTDEYPFLEFLGVITVGMVGTDYHKVIKLYVCVTGLIVAATIVAALGGIITNLVYLNSGDIRSAWGIGFPTDYASYFVFLCVGAWVAWKKVPDWVFALLAGASFLNAWRIAHSRTSMICSALLVMIMLSRYLAPNIVSWNRTKNGGKLSKEFLVFKRILSMLVTLAFPLFGVFVLVLTVCYAKGMSFAYAFDTLFSGRLGLAGKAYLNYGLSPFGTPFYQIGAGGTTYAHNGYNFVDSSYPLIMLRYGVVLLLVICAMWVLMSRKAITLGDWRLALGLAVIAFHSISEHHFTEMNYNVLLVLPFSVLGMNKSPAMAEQNESRRTKLLAGLITAALSFSALAFYGPMGLSLLRTAWDVTSSVNYEGKTELAFEALVIGLVVLALTLYSCYRIILMLLERHKPQKRMIAINVACLVVIGASVIVCNYVIARYEFRYMGIVTADNDAVEAVRAANRESGGEFYADEFPELYERAYGGFSTSFFTGDDLARLKNVSVIMDANYESACFLSRGFLYTQISDEHAIYTDDEVAIKKLEDAGYHLTGYYPKERSVDLVEEARLNGLQMTGDGALILDGEGKGHSLVYGPYLELRIGDYTISYDLSVPDDGFNPFEDEDYELGYLRVSTEWGQNVVKKTPVLRSQFDASGRYTAKVECKLGEVRGVEFLAIMEGGHELRIHGITYQKTPEYDTHVIYDGKYRKIREEYYDLEGNPYQMKEGYSARAFEYDNADNVSRETYLDAEGEPVATTKGYAQVARTYDNRRLVTREDFYDGRGEPILLDGGYASVEYKYDTARNRIETCYFGIDGLPVMLPDNYSIVRQAYDAKRRVVREEYFDTYDRPIKIRSGYAMMEHDYDEADNEIVQRLYDEAGNPVLNVYGWAEVRRQYDAEKRVVREEYFGANGNPITIKSGQAVTEYAYDTAGNRTDTRYYNVAGTPALVWNSYAGVHDDFNDKKQIIREWYYSLIGEEMMRRSEGFVMQECMYDEDGNANVLVYTDSDGNPVMRTDGYAELHRYYNAKRQVVRVEYYDVNGDPCSHIAGYYAVEYIYDVAGNMVEQRLLDQNGKLVNNVSGFAVERKEFDAFGNATRTTHYNKDMQVI